MNPHSLQNIIKMKNAALLRAIYTFCIAAMCLPITTFGQTVNVDIWDNPNNNDNCFICGENDWSSTTQSAYELY